MSELTPFNPEQSTPFDFRGHQVRVLTIEGQPYFVAADVAAALGYGGGARGAIARVPERMKGVANLNTPGGLQKLVVLSEPGVYRLVMRAQTDSAEAFQDWVAEEVLPSIRKTGTYAVPAHALDGLDLLRHQAAMHLATVEKMIEIERVVASHVRAIEAHDERVAALEDRTEILEASHERVAAVGYASMRGLRGDVMYLNRLGRAAAAIARRDGIPVERVHSTIWGQVNAWPVEVWDEALEQVGR